MCPLREGLRRQDSMLCPLALLMRLFLSLHPCCRLQGRAAARFVRISLLLFNKGCFLPHQPLFQTFLLSASLQTYQALWLRSQLPVFHKPLCKASLLRSPVAPAPAAEGGTG